jgi:hypothetical protein
MYQDPTNNNYIGLFNTAPSYSLDVNGTIQAQNDIWGRQKVYFPGLAGGSPSTQVVIWDSAFGQLYQTSASLLTVASASYAVNAGTAQTASYVLNAISASYALNATTSSYAATSSNILGGAQYYIPFFNTNTTVSSSFLYQSGSLLKTIYGGIDGGIYLDGFNSVYKFGQFQSSNFVGLVVDVNSGITKIADPDYISIFNGVGLVIDEDSSYIKSRYNGQDTGLLLDFANNQTELGNSNLISRYRSYTIGPNNFDEFTFISNSLGGDPVLMTGSVRSTGLNAAINIGDVTAFGNGTQLYIDDLTSTIGFTGSVISFDNVPSSATAGAIVGYITIKINGTNRKIPYYAV